MADRNVLKCGYCSASAALAFSFSMALVGLPTAAQVAAPKGSRTMVQAPNTVIPSQPTIVASSGAQTDVTDFVLFNDSGNVLRVAWINGNGVIQSNLATVPPGEPWVIANGAATWESHWYALSTNYGFVCSFSPRQFARVRVSDLTAC